MYINQTIKLPTKGRKALACSKDDLCNVLIASAKKGRPELSDLEDLNKEDLVEFGLYEFSDKILNDTDIDFDTENIVLGWYKEGGSFDNILIDIEIDGKRVPILKLYAGGDWEFPVNLICYLDDKKKIRFFSPKPGNTFNPLNKKAFGNGEEFDFFKTDDTEEVNLDEKFAQSVGYEDYEEFDEELECDTSLMLQAIKARLIAC